MVSSHVLASERGRRDATLRGWPSAGCTADCSWAPARVTSVGRRSVDHTLSHRIQCRTLLDDLRGRRTLLVPVIRERALHAAGLEARMRTAVLLLGITLSCVADTAADPVTLSGTGTVESAEPSLGF